jgi:hypothetical protein
MIRIGRKFATLAVAAIISISSLVVSARTADAQSLTATNFTSGSSLSSTFTLAAGIYDYNLSWAGVTFTPPQSGPRPSIIASFLNTTSGNFASYDLFAPIFSGNGGGASTQITVSSPATFSLTIFAQAYSVPFTVASLSASVAPVPPISVPGPLAGVGLPAVLALVGLGLYRRRRATA